MTDSGQDSTWSWIDAACVVACDFDGTITRDDVTNLIWDRHLPYDWRKVLLPPSVAGEVSPLEMIARGYAGVRQPPEALLAELRPQVSLREGFAAFLALCGDRNWPFSVLSYGLRFYVEAFLSGLPGAPHPAAEGAERAERTTAAISITAFEGTFRDGAWAVAPPPGSTPVGGSDFKVERVNWLQARHPDKVSVYIGDGRLDFPAARLCHRVFAVAGTALARLCADQGVACVEFTDFAEVAARLTTPTPPHRAG